MGKYLNKGNDGFRSARNSEFVDKSQLIEIVNATLNSERQYTCVSRAPRWHQLRQNHQTPHLHDRAAEEVRNKKKPSDARQTDFCDFCVT
jgi:hypothetical protein